MAEEIKVVEVDGDDEVFISTSGSGGTVAIRMPDNTEYIMNADTAEYIAFTILDWMKRYED